MTTLADKFRDATFPTIPTVMTEQRALLGLLRGPSILFDVNQAVALLDTITDAKGENDG